ncbi:MAG: DUF1294 domain-containing protein [Clostridia bacterium]|nr:DUF1294 domain-containing protein [Clostridia bacterium]
MRLIKITVIYLICINLLSAAVCAADKIKAAKHRRRIRERTLWLLSFAGGSVFMYLTMRLIRHKTLHKNFMIGLPFLIIIQIALILVLTKVNLRHIIPL